MTKTYITTPFGRTCGACRYKHHILADDYIAEFFGFNSHPSIQISVASHNMQTGITPGVYVAARSPTIRTEPSPDSKHRTLHQPPMSPTHVGLNCFEDWEDLFAPSTISGRGFDGSFRFKLLEFRV